MYHFAVEDITEAQLLKKHRKKHRQTTQNNIDVFYVEAIRITSHKKNYENDNETDDIPNNFHFYNNRTMDMSISIYYVPII